MPRRTRRRQPDFSRPEWRLPDLTCLCAKISSEFYVTGDPAEGGDLAGGDAELPVIFAGSCAIEKLLRRKRLDRRHDLSQQLPPDHPAQTSLVAYRKPDQE